MAHPVHYNQMKLYFGRSNGWLSLVFNETITYLARKYQKFLKFDQRRLTPDAIRKYCEVVHNHGGPDLVWGFVDGTTRDICRPSTMDQRSFYSGYTKTHCLKYQGVVTPDGLISSLYGPVTGKTHDARLWKETGIEMELRETFHGVDRLRVPLVYADSGYKVFSYGLTGAITTGRGLTADEARYNRLMSEFRTGIEHSFGNVSCKHWRSLSFTLGQAAGWSAVGAMYLVGVLLANCRNCMHPNQTSQYFDCPPPECHEYLGVPRQIGLELD
jgi:hypothetical protein